jgi:hypothetical protein
MGTFWVSKDALFATVKSQGFEKLDNKTPYIHPLKIRSNWCGISGADYIFTSIEKC